MPSPRPPPSPAASPTPPEPTQAAKPEPAKPEPAKPEPAKPEPAKPEPAKPAAVKPEPAKPEPAKPAPAATPPSGTAAETKPTLSLDELRKKIGEDIPRGFDDQMELAQRLVERYKYDSAQALYEYMLSYASAVPAIHNGLGTCAFEKNRGDEAIQHYLIGLKHHPADPYVLQGLARAYEQAGDNERALGRYRELERVSSERDRRKLRRTIEHLTLDDDGKATIDLSPRHYEVIDAAAMWLGSQDGGDWLKHTCDEIDLIRNMVRDITGLSRPVRSRIVAILNSTLRGS